MFRAKAIPRQRAGPFGGRAIVGRQRPPAIASPQLLSSPGIDCISWDFISYLMSLISQQKAVHCRATALLRVRLQYGWSVAP